MAKVKAALFNIVSPYVLNSTWLDLFAGTPLLFTVGIMIAHYYGESDIEHDKKDLIFLNTPPFWSAALALTLDLNHVEMPVLLVNPGLDFG